MGFLDLPPDIKHVIYSYYFACHLVRITTTEKVDADYVHDDVEVTGWNELMPLLLTCKQIHTNAGPYLNKVTVRVDMVDHYYAKLVNNFSRPNVTQYLVPAIEHVWKCMSRWTMLSQGRSAHETPRACLSNFQICLYDCSDHFEHAVESEDAASFIRAADNLPAEVAAGRYDGDIIGIGAMNASQTLARLKPSLPNIAFAETYVVFDLEVFYLIRPESMSRLEMRHLLRYLPDNLLNGDGKVLWRQPCGRALIEQPRDEVPLIGCDTSYA